MTMSCPGGDEVHSCAIRATKQPSSGKRKSEQTHHEELNYTTSKLHPWEWKWCNELRMHVSKWTVGPFDNALLGDLV